MKQDIKLIIILHLYQVNKLISIIILSINKIETRLLLHIILIEKKDKYIYFKYFFTFLNIKIFKYKNLYRLINNL